MALWRKRSTDQEEVVTMSVLRELLDKQKTEFANLLEQQEKNLKSFVELATDATHQRLNRLSREVLEANASLLQYSQNEVEDAKASSGQRHKRAKGTDNSDMLQLFVRRFTDGKTTILRIHKDSSVDKLFKKVSKKTSIPVSLLRVICDGKNLMEGEKKRLSDYSVENMATIHVVLRLSPGGGRPCSECHPLDGPHPQNPLDEPHLATRPEPEEAPSETSSVSDTEEESWQLYVEYNDGRTDVISIHKDASVDEMINKICEKKNTSLDVDPGFLRFLYNRRLLEYGRGQHLSDFSIEDQSTVHVAMPFLPSEGVFSETRQKLQEEED
ncbi:uncharacterized protein [Branchiostoma lanceolatum]|uniref:uncharacterized protein n=1 Tax=Branchiostoma lanceolatum TaxID=7740 RepID=UPI0034543A28